MGKPWFRVKRYGLGAGLPCSWQGWAVTAAFFAILIGTDVLVRPRPDANLAIFLADAAVFILVARLKSDAPWKWRWGRE